jgi:hypothetical protein
MGQDWDVDTLIEAPNGNQDAAMLTEPVQRLCGVSRHFGVVLIRLQSDLRQRGGNFCELLLILTIDEPSILLTVVLTQDTCGKGWLCGPPSSRSLPDG